MTKYVRLFYKGNLQSIQETLKGALKKVRGNRRKRILKLLNYIAENWEGIVNTEAIERLWTIEGQIQHNVGRRMKRLGARWSIDGGDRMARILAEKANICETYNKLQKKYLLQQAVRLFLKIYLLNLDTNWGRI